MIHFCSTCENRERCLDCREHPLIGCESGVPEKRIIVNADLVRVMNDRELATFLCGHGFCVDRRCPHLWDETDCIECVTEWLKSEVK